MTSKATLEGMALEVHEMAVRKGWWDNPLQERIPRLMVWLHEEVEEASSAWAHYGADDFERIDFDGFMKPEGLPSELADIFLIVADIAAGLNIDLAAAVRTKLTYDLVRRYKRDKAGVAPAAVTREPFEEAP